MIRFTIHTDTSDYQLGAVSISQNNKPITFFSRKLSKAQCNCTTTVKELLAIQWNPFMLLNWHMVRPQESGLRSHPKWGISTGYRMAPHTQRIWARHPAHSWNWQHSRRYAHPPVFGKYWPRRQQYWKSTLDKQTVDDKWQSYRW